MKDHKYFKDRRDWVDYKIQYHPSGRQGYFTCRGRLIGSIETDDETGELLSFDPRPDHIMSRHDRKIENQDAENRPQELLTQLDKYFTRERNRQETIECNQWLEEQRRIAHETELRRQSYGESNSFNSSNEPSIFSKW